MTAQEYAKDLKRGVGWPRAMRIAENLMKNTAPSEWENVPQSSVFYKKDRRGRPLKVLDYKHMAKNHNYWTNVFYELRKLG